MIPLPRLRFAHLPTPVEPLPRLSAALGGPRLLVKRDDQTGLGLGGNKTRKLELLLAEAQAHGAKTLLTAGAAQSNHCRQTAAAAARYGFGCRLILVSEDGLPVPPSGNLILDQLLGAELVWTKLEDRDRVLKEEFQKAWDDGLRPYLIPYGGSSSTGAFAYCLALQELLEQGVRPDWIVFASSSGGTQAGLALGAKLFDFRGRILGISVDREAVALQAGVAALATETADAVGEKLHFLPEEILVNDEYLGEGYGKPGEGEREALQLFAQKEGLLLDPVYTGRAAAGLIDLIRKGFFSPNDTVLFWHTGGAPALFAERYRGLFTG